MNRILFINKKDGEGISTDEVIEIFENTDDIEKIKATVEGAEERMLVTWASVEMKDNEGELIPIDDIIKEQDILLERNGPITDTHTNRIHGETLAYKLLEHPKTHTMGLLHLDKFFNHNELDDKVWSEIVSGERKGSSVGGFNTGVSQGTDDYTGEKVTILEGFHHMETASVEEPCNPMALNEAFSTVAKSNKSNVTKPGESKLDRCVADLMDDPEFKPQAGRTKEQSAFAICQASINKELAEKSLNKQEDDEETEEKVKKVETHINKKDIKNNILNKKGDIMLKTKKTKKEDVPDEEELENKQDEEEEKQEEEDKKKQDDEEEKTEHLDEEKKKTKKQDDEEEEEKKKQDEEEPEEKKKEEAAGDIEGETDAENEEGPKVEDPNQQTAFKTMEKKMDALSDKMLKKIDKAVSSITTPRPGVIGNVAKNNTYEKIPLMVAKGKKKLSFPEATRLHNEYMDDNQGGGF